MLVTDWIWRGDWLALRAMTKSNGRKPALEWFEDLDDRGKTKVFAAAQNLENSLRSGRPPGERAVKVAVSTQGLWELRATPPGASAPHLRLLYKRVGQTLWVATGFTKQKNTLDKKDVRVADNIAGDWRDDD